MVELGPSQYRVQVRFKKVIGSAFFVTNYNREYGSESNLAEVKFESAVGPQKKT